MDRVFIEGLEVSATIGCHPWERRGPRPLVVDLELAHDNRPAAASDALADAVDYEAVAQRIAALAAESDCELLETFAERCAQALLREFGAEWLRLRIGKPGAVRGARTAGVSIERGRADLHGAGGAGVSAAGARAGGSARDTATGGSEARAATSRTAASSVDADALAVRLAQLPGGMQRRRSTDRRPRPRSRAYLSLGSNLEPEANLAAAVAELRARFGDVVVSPVYRSPADGFRGPDFLNAVVAIDSDIHPFALDEWLHALEEAHGRDARDADYSNRPLDIDIIYFGELVLDGPGDFQLPRPELHHAFVLKPLADIAPDFVDPIRNKTLAQLWAAHPRHRDPPAQVDVVL
jgi:2-amino-4-hydroxy-6-hydroxymethyldihydropteridine diphosphokinase